MSAASPRLVTRGRPFSGFAGTLSLALLAGCALGAADPPGQSGQPAALGATEAAPSPGPAPTEWPMLAFDAARRGGNPATLRPPFARKWYRMFADEGLQSGVQPIIAGGRVFLGTLRGTLHAIDAETGRDAWVFRTSGPILHAAAAGDGRVCVGSADGQVYAVDAGQGTEAWRFTTGAAVWNAPSIVAGTVVIGSRDGHLYALDLVTGKPRWVADTGAPILQSPATDLRAGRVYVGSEDLRVRAFALQDGREWWRSDPLPGASFRGYYPVIAPDGSVLVTTQPVMGYDRFQELLLEMVRAVFGDFASWRHSQTENHQLRAANFRQLDNPETHAAQLDYLRRRLTAEPAFQTFFVLDPATGRLRFVTPIVSSESMNGPAAPPLVTPDGRVIVKYQILSRSRYEHYSPFLNVGYLDTRTGRIEPLMDESRTYGWHDSLLLVHDEQCQLSYAGRLLLNTHQDNVNALDLDSLVGYSDPLALNLHEPAPGEALALRLASLRGQPLPAGAEWFIRGTAVYGGGSVLDVPVAVAGDSFYYLPTHEINSGCALIAYRATPGAPAPKKAHLDRPALTDAEWHQIQNLPWDWDTLATPRLKNLLESLPAAPPGTAGAPLTHEAQTVVTPLSDAALDTVIWTPAFDPARPAPATASESTLVARLRAGVRELLDGPWQPLVIPAAKAPEESYRYFNDPSETVYTLLLARPFLDAELQARADEHLASLIEPQLQPTYAATLGKSRVPYPVPFERVRVREEVVRDDLARLYPLWLWSRTPRGAGFATNHWPEVRSRVRTPAGKVDDDCGNGRLAGLLAYCRFAKAASDEAALAEALPITREALRSRLAYELAHPRGGLLHPVPNGRMVCARWRRLTPDVARYLATYAPGITPGLMAVYVDYHRPGWWLAWNVEQLMRNEAPFQLPTTPLEIFTARALLLREPGSALRGYLDLPWCRADEYYLQKLALTLQAPRQPGE